MQSTIMKNIFLLFLVCGAALAVPPFPTQLPCYVHDGTGSLSAEEEALVQELGTALQKASRSGFMLAVEPGLDGLSQQAYGKELLSTWQLGDKNLNNGLVLLHTPKEGFHVETGYGLNSVFSYQRQQELLKPYGDGNAPGAPLRAFLALVTAYCDEYQVALPAATVSAAGLTLSAVPEVAPCPQVYPWVVDGAGMLSQEQKDAIQLVSKEFLIKADLTLMVVTSRGLGCPIRSYARALGNAWGLGGSYQRYIILGYDATEGELDARQRMCVVSGPGALFSDTIGNAMVARELKTAPPDNVYRTYLHLAQALKSRCVKPISKEASQKIAAIYPPWLHIGSAFLFVFVCGGIFRFFKGLRRK